MQAILNHPVLSGLVVIAAVCLFVLIAQVVLISSGDHQEKMQQPWS